MEEKLDGCDAAKQDRHTEAAGAILVEASLRIGSIQPLIDSKKKIISTDSFVGMGSPNYFSWFILNLYIQIPNNTSIYYGGGILGRVM